MKSESHLGHHWSWPNHINFLAAARKPAVADSTSSQNTFFHWLNFQGDFLAGQRKNLELSSWPSWHSRPDQPGKKEDLLSNFLSWSLKNFVYGCSLAAETPWQENYLFWRRSIWSNFAFVCQLLPVALQRFTQTVFVHLTKPSSQQQVQLMCCSLFSSSHSSLKIWKLLSSSAGNIAKMYSIHPSTLLLWIWVFSHTYYYTLCGFPFLMTFLPRCTLNNGGSNSKIDWSKAALPLFWKLFPRGTQLARKKSSTRTWAGKST